MSVYDDLPWRRSYDAWVAPEFERSEETYIDLLEKAFNFQPNRTAFFFLGNSLTFQKLNRLSANFAGYLQRQGLGSGDVVGINMPNTPQYLIALAGALRAGCVVSGVSPLLTPKETANQLNDSGARVLVTLDVFFEQRVLKIKNDVPELQCILTANIGDFMPPLKRALGRLLKKIPAGRVAPIPGKEVASFKKVAFFDQPMENAVAVSPDDPCLIQYTGGTTGAPKGAVLTHRNITANIAQTFDWLKLTMGGGSACSGFPFFHQAGLYFGLTTMAAAYTQCLIPDPRNIKHLCGEIADKRPGVMLHVPSLYQMMLNEPDFSRIDFSDLQVCISGAAPFSKEAIRTLEAVIGTGKVIEIYGMTEASPLITMTPLDGMKKIGSVGLPLPGTKVKIVDIETGTQPLPLGEDGEIIVNGPQVMKGYHGKPEETAYAIRELEGETWLYTGDVGRMDEDGYLYIADRTKDMLIVGGYKVFSREVEDVIGEHPAVEVCAIVGLPHPDRPDSQIVKAVIKLMEEARAEEQETVRREIIDYCRENLAPYKVPKIVEIMSEIPLTAVGKVDKKALRSG